MANMQIIPCKKCDGKMHSKIFKKHSKFLIIILVIIGIVFSVTIVGILIGMPLLLVALNLSQEEEYFWVCDKCHLKLSKRRQ